MVHHSISITSDDFDYFRRPVVVPLPWAAGCLGPAHYLSATTYNDVLRRPAWVSLPLAPGLRWSGDPEWLVWRDEHDEAWGWWIANRMPA